MGNDIFNIAISKGWAIWACVIFIVSLIGCVVFLYTQSKIKVDENIDGSANTKGNKWDETLEEYNNPLPAWWRNLFYLTLIFSFIYIILYPGIAVWGGIKNWTQWTQLVNEAEIHENKAQANLSKWSALSVDELSQDKNAMRSAKLLYLDKCARCHSADAGGFNDFGYPNLRDQDWLWGGSPKEITFSIENGRTGVMNAHKDFLSEEQIDEVANYVLLLAGRDFDSSKANAGRDTFNTYCVACHLQSGKGNKLLGGKDLTAGNFNWGSSITKIKEVISNGISNSMPAQLPILGKERSHLLAAYIWSLGGGKLEEESNSARTSCGSNPNETAKFYFASGKSDLSNDAQSCLKMYVEFSQNNPNSTIVLSGFHDSIGDPVYNAKLARDRAIVLQDALINAGVNKLSIETKKPENTLGSGSNAEARRVELTIN